MSELKKISQIIQIINNEDNTYKGDLKHYFKLLWNSDGIKNPYHNIRHILHVFWFTYEGLMAHHYDLLDPETMRVTLIAALFHDFNHKGKCGKDHNDFDNIKEACKKLSNYLHSDDLKYEGKIIECIACTEFPRKEAISTTPLPLYIQILRDVDLASTLHGTWIQQTIFGLGEEMGMEPNEMLKMQIPFVGNMKFETEWAERKYRPQINERLEEVNKMLKCLEIE
jgi:hypothetical protein